MSIPRIFNRILFSSSLLMAAACSSSKSTPTPPTSGDAAAADGGESGTDGREADASSGSHKRVFVTSATYTGAIDPNGQNADGTPDGDAACAAAAKSAGLAGSFKAWFSGISQGVTHDAVSRLADVGGWYLVGQNTLVFASKTALTSPPAHAIDHDENGRPVAADVLVWTGTTADGKLATPPAGGGFCNSWTSESAGNTGVVGKASSTTEWTASSPLAVEPCNARHSLYCFEQ